VECIETPLKVGKKLCFGGNWNASFATETELKPGSGKYYTVSQTR
jgi:hypothetical protein